MTLKDPRMLPEGYPADSPVLKEQVEELLKEGAAEIAEAAEYLRGNPPTRLAARNHAKTLIALERDRQLTLWGHGPMPLSLRLAVLAEEVGEVARAICDGEGDEHLLEELVQVGAVALRWAEDLLLEMKR